MNLRAEILREHSKQHTEQLAAWVGTDAERFAALVHLFLHDEYRVVQRSAGLVGLVAEKHPELIGPHLPALVARLSKTGAPVSVKRNIVRLLQFVAIPEDLHGTVMTACFDFLADTRETVAVRCHAMSVLAGLAKTYPEIGHELKLIISEAQEEQEVTAGFRARSRKVLKQLGQLERN